jgi:hypothetical protein
MRFNHMLRFTVKLSFAVAWAIILPIFYSSSKKYKACSAGRSKTFLGMFCLSNYMVVVALYLASNVIGMALFFVPAATSYIEISTWRICNILSWWCQVFLSLNTSFLPFSLLSKVIFYQKGIHCYIHRTSASPKFYEIQIFFPFIIINVRNNV